MIRIVTFLLIFFSFTSGAVSSPERDTLENILIIACHPDDWELGMAGTAYLLKDHYRIHIIVASDGELGNTWNTTGKPDPEVARLRVEHSRKSAEKIQATNYFFRMEDGGVYADEEAVKRTVKLLTDIDPEIIFLHWPIDKPDHAAAATMALMALSEAGMQRDREVYFFEVGRLSHFTPEVYVDVTPVWEVKRELVHIHERFGDDRLKEMAEQSAVYHGRTNGSQYAEGFRPLYPLSTSGSPGRSRCTLLDL